MKLKLELQGDIFLPEPKEVMAVSIGEEKFLETLYKLADKYHLLTESELQIINKIANEKSTRVDT